MMLRLQGLRVRADAGFGYEPVLDKCDDQHIHAKRTHVNAPLVLIDRLRDVRRRSRLSAGSRHHDVFQVCTAAALIHHYVGGDFVSRL